MKPTFSTLEVDIRGPHSTLEVDPRQYPADLEVKPADPKSPKVLVGEGQQPSDTGPTRSHTNPWHKSAVTYLNYNYHYGNYIHYGTIYYQVHLYTQPG
ncbi:unnamed protein product [Fusarium venenatum]|uniref:Uncharacterized protein n=1 Tax=Fusarium venenatum TaxID=56646 RepID=A0A2L2TUF2_9HYPO|nr:uncharacterized protein FVRRES_09374 [Fusarium venenatum]CEI69297.1 unnamed protein product [Fusarium venenatum]